MAPVQKRRSFSLSRRYHEALVAYSEQIKLPISKIIESSIFHELRDAGLLDDNDKKSSTDGKYWDPERKRWRVPAVNSRLSR